MAKECILVTGAAGFIGFHLCHILCERDYQVIGIDNLNEYYDVTLKHSRLQILREKSSFTFHQLDITDKKSMDSLFKNYDFHSVINLAAQAGVRHSITHPYDYLENNVHGFLNILEASRNNHIKHLIYASSGSVYGANKKTPFSVHDAVDHPLSLYAASKKSNELMAHTYSALYGLPTTGLRFFSVYGTYGRPDMALFIFTKAILEGKPIEVFNYGKMKRDFTFIDDVTETIVRLVKKIPQPDKTWNSLNPNPATSFAPYRLFNVGNSRSVDLMYYIELIEKNLGKKAVKKLLPIQDGDVSEALADVEDLIREIDFKPSTPIEVGVSKFVDWYLTYYNAR